MSTEPKKLALENIRKHEIASFVTVWDGKPVARVMSTVKVEDDFTLYFTTHNSSNKMQQIKENPNVCVLFYAEGADIRISGMAEIVDDPELKNSFWRDSWKQYFPKGIEDPEYGIIRIKPESVEYRNLEKGMSPDKIL